MRITRRRTICVILVVCLAAYARPVAAQTAPAQSLEELRTRLKAGDRLIVRDDSGDTARGTLSSLTDDEIEVEWRRWFRVRQQSFAETSIRRIEVQDSTWNGTLIGLAIGVAGIFVIDSTCRDPLCLLPMLLAPGIGAGVGGAVDQSINRTIYEPPGRTAAGRSQQDGLRPVGLTARIRF